jgi:DNA adenine methylase
MKTKLKTPISYYGGKQSMLKNILPMIPAHKVYCEPFFGGGAVFWAKEPTKAEIINDFNGMVVNFYEQLKLNFEELKRLVDATLFSRQTYHRAMVVYQNPYVFTPVVKAWAFWVVTNQSFNNEIGCFKPTQPKTKETSLIFNKKLNFTKELSERLDWTQIECTDAVNLIRRMDTPETFFYVDPPYVGANQGHYGGYTQEYFNELLEMLSKIKGKFILSSYPNEALDDYRSRFGWKNNDIDRQLSASPGSNKRQKVECLTVNF